MAMHWIGILVVLTAVNAKFIDSSDQQVETESLLPDTDHIYNVYEYEKSVDGKSTSGGADSVVLIDPVTTEKQKPVKEPTAIAVTATGKPEFTSPLPPCVDSYPKHCPIWKKNGFCDTPLYSDKQRQKFCSKSCDLCA